MAIYKTARKLIKLLGEVGALEYCDALASAEDKFMSKVKAAVIDLIETQVIGWREVKSSELLETGISNGALTMNPKRDLTRVKFNFTTVHRN